MAWNGGIWQYRIETLEIKKGGFKDYPIIPDEEHLDLVEREDQITTWLF